MRDGSRVMLTAYYARGVGRVGSMVPGANGFSVRCCYLNVGGTETGMRRPARASLLSHAVSKKLPVISTNHAIPGGVEEVGRTFHRTAR